jgi:hypothetical protein
MFNSIGKENVEIFEIYIINAFNIKVVPQLHVTIYWLDFFRAYISILQTSSEASKWWTNIHGAEKHEARTNWEGGGLLWANSEVGSWFINTNHKQFLD